MDRRYPSTQGAGGPPTALGPQELGERQGEWPRAPNRLVLHPGAPAKVQEPALSQFFRCRPHGLVFRTCLNPPCIFTADEWGIKARRVWNRLPTPTGGVAGGQHAWPRERPPRVSEASVQGNGLNYKQTRFKILGARTRVTSLVYDQDPEDHKSSRGRSLGAATCPFSVPLRQSHVNYAKR